MKASRRSPSAPLGVDPAADMAAHLQLLLIQCWKNYRHAFSRCRQHFSEKSVHQLRVETRRLLALLDLLESLGTDSSLDKLRRQLKKLFDRSSRLRDLQVQLLCLQSHLERFPETAAFHKSLRRRVKRRIRKFDDQVHDTAIAKAKKPLKKLTQKLPPLMHQAGLDHRGPPIIARAIHRAFARVISLRQRINPNRSDTIHRTRIAFKKFRYLLELLQPLLPAVTRQQLKQMHDYQTRMGEIQDLEVLQTNLAKFKRKHPKSTTALEPFTREIERQHSLLIARYLKEADQVRSFWKSPPPSVRHRSPTPKPKPNPPE